MKIHPLFQQIQDQNAYVDLDSHYNLDPDPSEGATMIDGITMNDNKPGHGSKLKTENYA